MINRGKIFRKVVAWFIIALFVICAVFFLAELLDGFGHALWAILYLILIAAVFAVVKWALEEVG